VSDLVTDPQLEELEGGTALDTPPRQTHEMLVAPTTSVHLNTIRAQLIPVGCWKMEDLRFEFDSSIIRPEARREFPKLAKLRAAHPGAPLSIFGHADPTSNDTYNKELSGRRAKAVFALLVRDLALWEDLYNSKIQGAGDPWKYKAVQVMLKALGRDPGPLTGTLTAPTIQAVKGFQRDNDLEGDGDPGPLTRAKLFPQYMDLIAVDEADAPFALQKTDFLAQGEDPNGKGDFQGCSEFNPLLMFSKSENQEFQKPAKKAARDRENAPNRRVMALLFRPGSKVTPGKWPCPRADEGFAGCKARFWSDATTRRQFQASRRKFEETQDTFACRFYHRLTTGSPCERTVPPPPVRVVTLEIILDNNNNQVVDAGEPVATFVRMGIWDHGWDPATGTLRNNEPEAQNFVGVDSVGREARRFYFRVRDPDASGQPQVQVTWRTEFGAGGNDDAPASQVITLLPTANPQVFVSRAVLLVGNDIDRDQATNSGLPAGNADAGSRNRGASNHRIRRLTVDDAHRLDTNVVAEYTPAAAGDNVVARLPLFNRGPDERRRIRVHLVNVRDAVGGAPVLDPGRRRATSDLIRSIYATCGIFAEINEIVIDPPASCINWSTRFPASGAIAVGADPAVEDSSFPGSVNLIPSASETDIINVIRARADFDANDIYLVYVTRLFRNPIPAPGPAAVLQASLAGGEAFPDTWTAAGSVARSFAFLGVRTTNALAEAHEMTHLTTNLRNSAGGHFHLQANVATGPGNIDGRNLMQRFALIQNGNTADSKRLWDEDFTNAGIAPPTIPAQIRAIRGSRFVRPL
jgi:hypothetical protein